MMAELMMTPANGHPSVKGSRRPGDRLIPLSCVFLDADLGSPGVRLSLGYGQYAPPCALRYKLCIDAALSCANASPFTDPVRQRAADLAGFTDREPALSFANDEPTISLRRAHPPPQYVSRYPTIGANANCSVSSDRCPHRLPTLQQASEPPDWR